MKIGSFFAGVFLATFIALWIFVINNQSANRLEMQKEMYQNTIRAKDDAIQYELKVANGETFLLNRRDGRVWRKIVVFEKNELITTYWSPMTLFHDAQEAYEWGEYYSKGTAPPTEEELQPEY